MALLLVACAAPVRAPVLLTLPVTAGSPDANKSADANTNTSPGPLATATMPARLPRLAVRRVGLPEYLLVRRVRYRADASTLAEWPNTYWAERIEIGVTREFAAALRTQLPGWEVCEAACAEAVAAPTLASLPALAPLVLQAEVTPLDYVRAARRLQARARIVVSQGIGAGTGTGTAAGTVPRVLQAREFAWDIEATADTPQAQAQTIAELLRRLAAASAPLVTAARP